MAVYTYDPSEVAVIVGGAIMQGFADGTFVEVERDEQAYEKVTGADGETSRAKTNNKSGNITITLKQTSPSNDILSGIMIADEADNSGVVPVLIKDRLGNTVFASSAAWVQQMPSSAYSKEIEEREWVLDCAKIDAFVAGNDSQEGANI